MNNENEPWSQNDEEELWNMLMVPYDIKPSTKEMAERLGRTINAIYNKAYELANKKKEKITFLPKDQEEYDSFKYNKIINTSNQETKNEKNRI